MDTRLKEAGAGAGSASSPSTFLTAWSAAVRRPGAGACCGRDGAGAGAGATKCCHSAADGEKGLRARHTGRERAACMRGALVGRGRLWRRLSCPCRCRCGWGQAVARPLGAASMEALRGCLCLECRYLVLRHQDYELPHAHRTGTDRRGVAGPCCTFIGPHCTLLDAAGGRCPSPPTLKAWIYINDWMTDHMFAEPHASQRLNKSACVCCSGALDQSRGRLYLR